MTVIITIALVILLLLVIIKNNFKVAYRVTVDGKTLGYVASKDEFTCTVTNQVLKQNENNVELVVLESVPQYSMSIINKNKKTDEETIVKTLKLKADVTYKLFAVTAGGEDKAYVDTLEIAKEKIKELSEKYGNQVESEFGVREVYTNNVIEYKEMKYATVTKYERILEADKIKKEEEVKKAEEAKKAAEEAAKKKAKQQASYSNANVAATNERIENASYIDDVAFTVTPVAGRISSRYGANESIRNHTHKGIDIAASNGTPIYAAADGQVVYAQYNSGGYGNLVIVSHGNGVETYYAHCSKLYVTKGQTVSAGTCLGAVGSTGYSTGNHLHFEIRKNGAQVNPQLYLFK